jgi:hypothetical protein
MFGNQPIVFLTVTLLETYTAATKMFHGAPYENV